MSNSIESQPNPLPRLFAAALGLLLVAVIIAISLTSRFSYSPPTSTSSDTSLTSQTTTATELVRQRALTVMASVGAMAGLVIIGGLVVSLLLNRRLNQHFTTAELWRNAHHTQPVPVVVDAKTMRCIQQVARTPRYADHSSQGRRR
jgi:hypothetical protein